jgi:transglycosylase-like protein
MALIASIFALMLPSGYASPDGASPSYPHAQTSSERAVQTAPAPEPATRERRFRTPHKGCQTHKCERRVIKKMRAKTNRRWLRYTAPYRGWLRSTRMCESGGNYSINTGNGFYGAYQFTISSWYAVGGWGMPHNARPLEQDYRAVRLLHVQGRGAWPVCG